MRVGEHLRTRLRAVSGVGEVRGAGLLAGIDLLTPSGRTDRELALEVLAGLVDRGVLAGLTGPAGTVLKVRPPLIWREEHADLFVDALDATLAGLCLDRNIPLS